MIIKLTAHIFVMSYLIHVFYVKASESDESIISNNIIDVRVTEVTAQDSRSAEEISDIKEKDSNQDGVKKKREVELQSSRTKQKLKYYFSVSIQKRGAHYATGAIVDTNWILSVAELFYNVRESINLYNARVGSFNCKKGGVVVPLKGIEIHPKYKYGLPNFDLALLRIPKIDTDIANYVHPIQLATFDENQIPSKKFWSTYWPRLIVRGKILSLSATERHKHSTMRVSPQQLIPRSDCRELLKSSTTLHNSSMCLAPIASYHSGCMPDAGAPIVTHKYLWAITSGWTSPDCPDNNSPTIATKVSSKFVLPWLKLVLNISTSLEEDMN
ncbi:trypsin 3A1-like [Aricia agestis]|uniref:trypsin 3A1-like n=1 Tax=Aricia agestis TaxID=91739 RepID=UPI001C20583A|nr:trypsin 3A1-like [Aricia agestis]